MTPQPRHPAEIPPGYPRRYVREVQLRDGRTTTVRPVLPGDAAQLGVAFRQADPETLRRRFLGAPPPVTPALLTHLTSLDYVRRFALVALDPVGARGVAIARYEPLADGVAEVAVVVDPGWRRAGLATVLVEMLAEAALERGVHAFSAVYFAENPPVTALIHLAAGQGEQRIDQGVAEFAVELDRERVAAAVRRLARQPRLPAPTRS